MYFRIITTSGRLCLDLGKLDRSAFLERLLGSDRDADGLKSVLAAYGNFLVIEDCIYKCLHLCDERIIVALKEEVCRLRRLNCLSGADESFVLKMVVVLDSALLAENFDALVIAVLMKASFSRWLLSWTAPFSQRTSTRWS